MICYRVKTDAYVKNYAPTYCKKYENAVRERNRMESETNKKWYIDRVKL